MKCYIVNGPVNGLILTLVFMAASFVAVFSAPPQIPADKSQLDKWFYDNVKPFSDRNAELDPMLVAAEVKARVINVSTDGKGNFKTITDAIKSVPSWNKQRVVIWIGKGVYKEKIKIDKSKPFITLYASPSDMPTLTFNGDANTTFGTVDSATLIVESNYFTAANLIIENSSPRPDRNTKGAQAVAARISGDKSSLYNCKLYGFQNTLCDDAGFHFFKDCYIRGTVDFIFGKGTSLYLNTELNVVGDGGLAVITAHARNGIKDMSGYSFAHCSITGTGGNNTYLGRAWMSRPRVVFSYTNMSDIIHPLGWINNNHTENDPKVLFGEYKCSGPGSNPEGRAKFSKRLTDVEVKPFISLGYIQSSKWLLPPPNPKP